MGIAFLLHLFAKKLYKDEAISQTIDVLSRINDVLKLEESLSRLIGDGLIINSSCVDRVSIKRYESNSTFKRKKREKKIIFSTSFVHPLNSLPTFASLRVQFYTIILDAQ